MTRSETAVRKATGIRLQADMATAARHVAFALDAFEETTLARAYIAGIIEATPSLTVRACILTAWS